MVAVDGTVTARAQSGEPFPVSVGAVLCPRDEITTGQRSRVEFRLAGKDTTTGSSSNAVTVIPAPDSECVTLLAGIISFISSVRGRHCIRTPFFDAGIEGTEAVLAVDGATGDSFVLVRNGLVSVVDRRDATERLALLAGPAEGDAAAFATAAQLLTLATPENVPVKFRDLLLRPDNATDWAIYYPPILLGAGVDDAAVREAAALLDAGEPDAAEALLARAGLRGRAAAAGFALRAVAAVARNDIAAGGAMADEAVALDPDLGAAHIAQSYALQGEGRLDAAREAAGRAVAASPDDAYAWARLAELQLTIGAWRDARRSIARSLELAETALGRTIEGFSGLASNEFEAAEVALRRAIELDSEAPLPRLGLGLAAIRQGRVADGRLEIEAAVALDPRRASLRTWLGRAYFEEGLTDEAATQFAIAQERDPDDPNAYLFSALERYQANDPIGALRALETAEARGDRRAVVRSEAGLGEDRAVRSAAIGRVYDVLGFEQMAAQEAARALVRDPTASDAHRFLSDIYRTRPGFEIAQTSELLQARLLSPPNAEPIQPQLTEADLALLEENGPARVTFHEFSPLFNREGFQFLASGAAGTNATFGDELSFGLLQDKFSLSSGQYHYQTDGFRFNDEVSHDIVSILAKGTLSPQLTLVAEGRLRKTDEGDRFLRSFSDPGVPTLDRELSQALIRAAAHIEPDESNDILAVATFSEIRDESREVVIDPFLLVPIETQDVENGDAFTLEFQDILRVADQHVIGGVRYGQSKSDFNLDSFPVFELESDEFTGYLYGVFQPVKWATVTLGASYDHTESTDSDLFSGQVIDRTFNQVNPKLGVSINPLSYLTIRAAYLRTLKHQALADETIEPTTVAGFNQFYDDHDFTDAKLVGAGVDIRFGPRVFLTSEYLHRDLEIPDTVTNTITFLNEPVIIPGEERITRIELNTVVSDRLTASLGVEQLDTETGLFDRPDTVETLLVPARFRYFHPLGGFASLDIIFFDQESKGEVGDQFGGFIDVDTDEQGVVLNASVGYRFPKNLGVASIEFYNIIDENFSFQNQLVNSARPSTRPLAEEFSVLGRVVVRF